MMRLVQSNAAALAQMCSLFENLEDALWNRSAPGTDGLRIGPQVRHVVDFYECFFQGLRSGRIDYDARRRDTAIEENRSVALEVMRVLVRQLEGLSALHSDVSLLVREDDVMLHSSLGRELSSLLHHTIHHMALIAVALRAFGIAVDPSFGVAPSTLRWRQQVEAAA